MNVLATHLYDMGDNYEVCRQIHDLCVKSYLANLRDIDEHVVFMGKASGYPEMLQGIFERTEELWNRGANVLQTDSDIVCIKPVGVFGEYHRMTMFNLNEDASPRGDVEAGYYLHSGVRYLPQAMDPCLWQLVRYLRAQWSEAWAYDQAIYNTMFWAQADVKKENVLDYINPRLCWNKPCVGPEMNNWGVPIEEACMIHFHMSRDPAGALAQMREYVS